MFRKFPTGFCTTAVERATRSFKISNDLGAWALEARKKRGSGLHAFSDDVVEAGLRRFIVKAHEAIDKYSVKTSS